MMGNLFGSGSNPKMEEALQQRMLMQAFGVKDEAEAIYAGAEVAGDDSESGYPGILSLRLFGATPMTPRVRLQLLTTGELQTTPATLRRLAESLARWADEVEEPLAKAKSDAQGMEIFKLFGSMK